MDPPEGSILYAIGALESRIGASAFWDFSKALGSSRADVLMERNSQASQCSTQAPAPKIGCKCSYLHACLAILHACTGDLYTYVYTTFSLRAATGIYPIS